MKVVVKTARLVPFLVPLLLLLIVGLAPSAQATAETDAAAPFESIAEISEEDEGEEECVEVGEEEEEAGEEEEECEAEAEGSGSVSAEDCFLRTVHARIVAFPDRNMVRLTLGYTTYAPAQATVEYKVKHDRLGAVNRRLGRSGVVRLNKHLGDREMSRVQGSGRFTVTVHVSEAPGACQRFESAQLEVEHSSDSRITWSEND
jgi:hypothetical protein